ncbi:cytochrome P450 [Xylaria sp. CBS 124048]|nr:cytochrome P450 [Xylaria sp. CBS 124048]
MMSTIFLVAGAFVAWSVFRYVTGLRRNIALAKSTGLPYLVVPVNPFSNFSRAFARIWVPIWKLTPKRYWESAIEVCEESWQYKKGFALFAKTNENILVVTPTIMMLHTATPELIHEITSKREDFPKPTEFYGILAMFGRNVVTTEGAEWRMHRKVTSASFNEKNSALVFKAAADLAQGMADFWLQTQKTAGRIDTIEQDTMSLALNIISYVGFGLRLVWPGQPLPADTDSRMAKYASFDPPAGHTLTFRAAISGVLEQLLVLLMTPPILLNNIPHPKFKIAKEARENYDLYMREFIQDKVQDVRRGDKEIGMDIMGSLVKTSYEEKQDNGKAGVRLNDSEIIGNAFIMFLAGHETTGNVMHFTLLHLANNPATQRQLQRDIDAILGPDSDPATWNYEEKVNAMQASMIGAVMNETLRMMPPVIEVPKKVGPTKAQPIVIKGARYTLPPNTYIGLCVSAAARNPRCWPAKPSKITGAADDLDDWVPERWFRSSISEAETQHSEVPEAEDFGGFAGSDTSASMFRPVRGSFIPFSDGARSCLGRRIAIVELLAVFAVIFQKYSIENVVDASDEEIERADRAQRTEMYKKSIDESRKILSTCETRITLKLHNGLHVPLRLVKRGEERFVNWYDS